MNLISFICIFLACFTVVALFIVVQAMRMWKMLEDDHKWRKDRGLFKHYNKEK